VCSANKRNSDRECPNTFETSIVKITVEDKEQKTAKHNTDVSLPEKHFGGKTGKIQSCCALNKNVREEDEVSNERKVSKVDTDETSAAGKSTEDKQKPVCEDGLAKNKHDERSEAERKFSTDLERFSNKEESRLEKKGQNKDISSTITGLNDQSFRNTSFAKINLNHSAVKFGEREDETGKTSQTAHTVSSKEVNSKPEVGQTCVYLKVEHEKKFTEPQNDESTSDISAEPSRRTSSRVATSCNKHKTHPQDKERNVQRRAVKCAEKMKLKMAENTNTKLRSRAVIKQPGHENRQKKGK
jgi:hypothetical protein